MTDAWATPQRYPPGPYHLHQHQHLVHPSPVRAHSYPFQAAPLALHAPAHLSLAQLQAGWSGSSPPSASSSHTGSTSSHTFYTHHPPSPPLSASTMPDPWGAEREKPIPIEDDDDHPRPWAPNGAGTGAAHEETNGHAHPHPHHHHHNHSYSSQQQGMATKPRGLSPKRLPGPHAVEVLAALMDLSKGRDKILKIVQYSMRSYLYVLGLIAAVRPLTKWFTANRKRTQIAVSGLSLTRKCLLLLNPLRPAGALLSPEPTSAREFLGHLVDLVGALADDVYCLSKLGIMSRKKGAIADRWANRIWFLNTLSGLWNLHVKARTTNRSQSEKTQDEWSRTKYLCDLVFVSYDVFHLTWFKEPVQCATGLTAAFISAGQLYNKQHAQLSKR
ncbi:hypothetical protein Q8F55_001894 [Vanrija albida]|uniref:Peroxisomal membrane protein PEX16 n=1 Tax=Vanrija albida TaxID=181172 RepID=A0ABR3Q892_9TREE